MGNYSGKLDFLKLKNACVISINGKTGAKKGVFVPIEENNLFVSIDENNKAKGVYFNFVALESKQISKFGDTHMIKQNLDKEVRAKMSEEEGKNIPILGNMKPFESKNAVQTVEAPVNSIVQEEDDDSLPF